MPDKGAKSLPPLVVAMLLADNAGRDAQTGKFMIAGTFDVINAAKFPCRHRAMHVYLALTGGHGSVPVTVKVVDADEARPAIAASEQVLHFGDPRECLETVMPFYHLPLPEPGEYRVQLWAAGEVLRERRLLVRPRAAPGQPPAGKPD